MPHPTAMNPLTDFVNLIRTLTGGLTPQSLAAFLLDGIPYLVQGVQLFIFIVIYTVLHSGLLGSMKTAGGKYTESEDTNGKASHGNGKPTCPYAKRSEQYPYIAPKREDDRSPCPALNTLANHGFM